MPEQEKTFTLQAGLPSYYSALHAYCGVPLLSFVTLRGVDPAFVGSPVLRISGAFEGCPILAREIEAPRLCAQSTDAQGETTAVLDLTSNKIFPDASFWKTCRSRLTAPIRIAVKWGDCTAAATVNVRFLPKDAFTPELSPEFFACHVRPAHPALEGVCEEANSLLWELYGVAPNDRRAASPARRADALFRAILHRELSYSAALPEVFIQEGNVRDFSVFLKGNVRSVSRSEAALLFASCAERLGLFCSIICLRVGAGAIHVMLGVRVDETFSQNALSESVSTLRELIADGKLLVFDVESLLHCENADIRKSASESAALIFKSSTAVSFILDVAGARVNGVRSLSPYGAAPQSSGGEGLQKTVETIVKNERRHTLFDFSPYRAQVLGVAAKPGELKPGTVYTLSPCDDELFAQFPDALSLLTAFDGRFPRTASRTLGEQAACDEKQRRFEEKRTAGLKKSALRIYPSAYVLSCEKTDTQGLRDACRRTLDALLNDLRSDDPKPCGRGLFAAVGSVLFEEDGKKACAPVLFVPCELRTADGEMRLVYGSDKVVWNRTLYRHLSSLSPALEGREENGLSLRAYAALCEASDGKASYVGDVLLSVFDLSYTHMCACFERAAGSPFESYLESGRYVLSTVKPGGFAPSSMPFALSSEQQSAVVGTQTDSAVLFGLPGTGENTVCAGAIARTALDGGHVLVSSPYADSLRTLLRTVEDADAQGLCLPMTDKEDMKRCILRDLALVSQKPENADLADPSDELNAAAAFLDAYTKELYTVRESGYSLSDCVREYYEAGAVSGTVLPVDFAGAGRPVQKADVETLIALSHNLVSSAEALSEAVGNQTARAVGFSHLYTQTPPPAQVRKTLADAAEKLRGLREHSQFLRDGMRIAAQDLTTVRALLAFGAFLTRLLHYGEKRLPASLAEKNVPDVLDLLKKVCELLETRKNAQTTLGTVSADLSQEPYAAVCERWKTAKNNPFTRGGVLRDLRKLLPENEKKSGAEAASLLAAYFEREDVDAALTKIGPEAKEALGTLWQSSATDLAKIGELRDLLCGAEKDVKDLFASRPERADDLFGVVSSALAAVHGEENGREGLVLSVSDFSALSSDGFTHGLLCDAFRALGCHFEELDYPNGVLEEDGLPASLLCWREHFGAAGALCAFNTAAKRACDAGLSAFADAAKDTLDFDGLSVTFRQSVFASLVKLSAQGKACLLPEPYRAMREKFAELYEAQRRFAAARLTGRRRASLSRFFSTAEGKTALASLKKDLDDPAASPVRVFERNASLLDLMYTAYLLPLYDALRLPFLPASLILLDADKTEAAPGVALCAGFDRCLFVTRPGAKKGSLIPALPAGLPAFRLTSRDPGSNGCVSAFLAEGFADLLKDYALPADPDAVRFVHVPSGLYDRASRTNAIEAVAAAETAWALGEKYGFDNVGVLVSTLPQRREVEQALLLLSRKFSRPEGQTVPVRAVGACGDLGRDHLVLSVTFGKNMYAMTRTFGDADSADDSPAGGSSFLSTLLYARKTLTVVASALPEEIVPDSVSPGAYTVRRLLTFAKYRTQPDGKTFAQPRHERLIDRVLPGGVCHAPLTAILNASERRAAVFDGDKTKAAYDRVLLPETILARGGYTVTPMVLADLVP